MSLVGGNLSLRS